jgi:hypothetical protein
MLALGLAKQALFVYIVKNVLTKGIGVECVLRWEERELWRPQETLLRAVAESLAGARCSHR